MRKFALSLIIFLLCLGGVSAHAEDLIDAVRSAKRTNVVAFGTSIKSDLITPPRAGSGADGISAQQQRGELQSARGDTGVIIDSGRAAKNAPVSAAPRAGTVAPRGASDRLPVSGARSAISGTIIPRAVQNNNSASSAQRNFAPARAGIVNVSRAAMDMPPVPQKKSIDTDAAPKTTSSASGYKKCREVYYGCMDEFCANKDTTLKRCACSARSSDFDAVKKQMSKVEDSILNFNERLLTVNMEKEDAAAISLATAGEKAYQIDDKSSSKTILDTISKKLKASTADTDFNKNMTAISLSLDIDSAFDDIDSLKGAGTTTKSGAALYNAANPICREMVAEVCDKDGAAIAESGYQMAIEQDCNTVAKTYETMTEQAKDKVREGSALLDMSRLDIYQKRNSDDILACKKKMLDLMTDSSVCGENLGKCLDITGKYIDPSTGAAFLTVNLVGLSDVIKRPDSGQKWTGVPGNEVFVSYLTSKKKYLEPAMENCQDVSDRVWLDFIEDALGQIKLAQEKKLEDMRQSCTSLTTQCIVNTSTSISDFDARALSIFGVTANKTVNEMCANVKASCTALLETTGGDADWVGGMTDIATTKTYETILKTCREVGKACIIQNCKSISGNFGLCESVTKSVNRKAIIRRSSCWSDVLQCVESAGSDSINEIMTKYKKSPTNNSGDFYIENFADENVRTNAKNAVCEPQIKNGNPAQSCVYDICTDCGKEGYPNCGTCRIAEEIWGNCEFEPTSKLETSGSQNKIKSTRTGIETLLSWFDINTGTTNDLASCTDSFCGIGYTASLRSDGTVSCINNANMSGDGMEATPEQQLKINPSFTNYSTLSNDFYGNACEKGITPITSLDSSAATGYFNIDSVGVSTNICTSGVATNSFVAAFNITSDAYYPPDMNFMICAGSLVDEDTSAEFPGGQTKRCNGRFILINSASGIYLSPNFNISGAQTPTYPNNYYNLNGNVECLFNLATKQWGTAGGCDKITGIPTKPINNFFIRY